MSRQKKNARNLAIAKQFSALRTGGGHGPERTVPKHGKVDRVTEPGTKAYTKREELLGKIRVRLQDGKGFSDLQGRA